MILQFDLKSRFQQFYMPQAIKQILERSGRESVHNFNLQYDY